MHVRNNRPQDSKIYCLLGPWKPAYYLSNWNKPPSRVSWILTPKIGFLKNPLNEEYFKRLTILLTPLATPMSKEAYILITDISKIFKPYFPHPESSSVAIITGFTWLGLPRCSSQEKVTFHLASCITEKTYHFCCPSETSVLFWVFLLVCFCFCLPWGVDMKRYNIKPSFKKHTWVI